MPELKSLTIGGSTYNFVDQIARDNSSNNGMPKIYKWEQHEMVLSSYDKGASTTQSGRFGCMVSLNDSSGWQARGLKTAKAALLNPYSQSYYNYLGKSSINSNYPYLVLHPVMEGLVTDYLFESDPVWTPGIYEISSISITETPHEIYYDVFYYEYNYSITGKLLTNPVYTDTFLGYKYGLALEATSLFPSGVDWEYILTNPDVPNT